MIPILNAPQTLLVRDTIWTIQRDTKLILFKRNEPYWFEKPSGVFPSFEWVDYISEKNDSNEKIGVFLCYIKDYPLMRSEIDTIYLTLLRSIILLSSDGIMGPCIPTPDAAESETVYFQIFYTPTRK